MKVYVAQFDGDIRDLPPIVENTLEECLLKIQEEYEFGKVTTEVYHGNYYREYQTPDPEDDKIEVWEIDSKNKIIKVVWGFWGWHWTVPEGLEQGKMPGHEKSLYVLAMGE